MVPSTNLGSVLEGLRDLEGVFGSFVLTRDGELVGKDLPAVFDEALFEEVGPRISRLTDTLVDQDDKLTMLSLSAGSYKLHLRGLSDGLLGVLMSTHANLPALNMAINVAVRRMPPPRTARIESVPVPPPPSVPTVPHQAIPSPHPLPPAGAIPYPPERKTVPPPFRAVGLNDQQPAGPPTNRSRVASEENTQLTPAVTNPHDAQPRAVRQVMFRGRKLRDE